MAQFRRGFGIRITRGWAALIVLAFVVGVAGYWLGPLRPIPPQLELLALAGDDALPEVTVRGAVHPQDGTLRFPLHLVIRNAGTQTARPQQLALHVPARFRLVTPRGRLAGEVAPGVPLRRYVFPVGVAPLQPGSPPQPLAGLDTVWLEPDLPRYYCTAQAPNVPEFISAPQYDPQTLSDVRIFYSVLTGQQRSTGVLRVQVDPQQLAVTPAPMPPPFPTTFEDEVRPPDLGLLREGGTRTAWCGDPEQPMELQVVQWLGTGGAAMYVIYVQGMPRKHLYDLNGDGTVDLETWDINGDGRFDARRQARFPVPEFLQPLPEREVLPDTLPPDPEWLALFHNVAAGPLRFTRPPPRVAVVDTAAPGTPPTAPAAIEPLPPPDSAWLALFLDAASGPFRFTRGTRPATPQQTQPDTLPPGVQDTVPADTAPRPPPPRRRVPLGVPVDPGR